MSKKRTMPDVYRTRKRICATATTNHTIQPATSHTNHITPTTNQATNYTNHITPTTNQATNYTNHIATTTNQATNYTNHITTTTNQATNYTNHITPATNHNSAAVNHASQLSTCTSQAGWTNHASHTTLTYNGTTEAEWNNGETSNHIENSSIPNDTSCALTYLKNLFPVDKFEGRLPPIVLKHQLYSILNSRTLVDQQLIQLRNNGDIRLFKLGSDANDFSVLFTADYKAHVRKFIQNMSLNTAVIERFLSVVIEQCQDISLTKHKMMTELRFKDEEITQLVKACVLTVRDVGSWWIAIPSAGVFMKSFIRGRKAVLTMIRKCKYKEIIREELKTRKLPRIARLGMEYHIYDIIGADLVECVPTTSGMLLRLQE